MVSTCVWASEITVTACVTTDNYFQSGNTYKLGNDVQATSGDCFRTYGNNFVFDGNGHVISCAATCATCTNGFLAYGQNVTIKNVVVNGFQTGISGGTSISGNTVGNSADCGVPIYGIVPQSYAVVQYNTITNLVSTAKPSIIVYPIYLNVVPNVTVFSNTIQNILGKSQLITVLNSPYAVIESNTVTSIAGYTPPQCNNATFAQGITGVYMYQSTGTVIAYNSFSNWAAGSGTLCYDASVKNVPKFGASIIGVNSNYSPAQIFNNTFTNFAGGNGSYIYDNVNQPYGGDVYGIYQSTSYSTGSYIGCNTFSNFRGGHGGEYQVLNRTGVVGPAGTSYGVYSIGTQCTIVGNSFTNLAGGVGAPGGRALSISVSGAAFVASNSISGIYGGVGADIYTSQTYVYPGVGGTAYGIFVNTNGPNVTFNSITNIVGGNGGNEVIRFVAGGNGGDAFGIYSIYGASLSRNSVSSIVSGRTGINFNNGAVGINGTVFIVETASRTCLPQASNVNLCFPASTACCSSACLDTCQAPAPSGSCASSVAGPTTASTSTTTSSDPTTATSSSSTTGGSSTGGSSTTGSSSTGGSSSTSGASTTSSTSSTTTTQGATSSKANSGNTLRLGLVATTAVLATFFVLL